MKVLFMKWLDSPAEWWEFWKPRSGFAGGCIMGLIGVIIIILI